MIIAIITFIACIVSSIYFMLGLMELTIPIIFICTFLLMLYIEHISTNIIINYLNNHMDLMRLLSEKTIIKEDN